jgi:hypothetical protein
VSEINGKRILVNGGSSNFAAISRRKLRVCPGRAGFCGRLHNTYPDHELVISHRNIHIAPHHQL